MTIKDYIHLPAEIPASCAFCGDDMNILAVTTASYDADIASDKNAGFTILIDTLTKGRDPYIFG